MSKTKKPMVVEVSKRRWLRGEGDDDSALLRKRDRKMCCLGFACRKAGIKAASIMEAGLPADICHLASLDMDRLDTAGLFKPWCDRAAEINDSMALSDAERMKQLRALGKANGIIFRFVP